MHVAAIVAAGGKGVRLGADRPKQFLDVGGRSLFDLSLSALLASDRIHELVAAVPNEYVEGLTNEWTGRTAKPLAFVAGGRRRQDSVANAFAKVSRDADIVIVHDAARPFVSNEVIARTVDGASAHGAAIAAISIRDTVKQADRAQADGARPILSTISRETVFLAQTPQAFRRQIFADVLASAGDADATDEASLAERAGIPVWLVEGDAANMKVTTAADFEEAQARVRGAGARGEGVLRIGTGYDLHRLVARRPLILGGVRIPFDFGLDGHSDADIVCHAVTDAVLGAAAAGDIGRLFPDNDPQWKNADSIAMLRGAVARVQGMGYRVSNVDATVIAERPKLLPHLEAMRANLASALAVDVNAVSIKGKTNEGQDATGRGEAMACHAVALLAMRHSPFAFREEQKANGELPETNGEKS